MALERLRYAVLGDDAHIDISCKRAATEDEVKAAIYLICGQEIVLDCYDNMVACYTGNWRGLTVHLEDPTFVCVRNDEDPGIFLNIIKVAVLIISILDDCDPPMDFNKKTEDIITQAVHDARDKDNISDESLGFVSHEARVDAALACIREIIEECA
jgi:hypothetical protein